MNFKAKIFLATLSILIVTLLLNSMMSIISFEKTYVESLISTYELTGNSLKRKIERALKFGKPLDKFQGMSSLFQKSAENNKNISTIWITDRKGKLLYEYSKNKSVRLPSISNLKSKKLSENQMAQTIQTSNHYVTVLDLKNGSEKFVGNLFIAFPKKAIYTKIKEMVISNLSILWPILAGASLCLIILMVMLIFRPMKKEFSEILELFEEKKFKQELTFDKLNDSIPADNSQKSVIGNLTAKEKIKTEYTEKIDFRQSKNEIDMIKKQIRMFLYYYNDTKEKIYSHNKEQEYLLNFPEQLRQADDEIRSRLDDSIEECPNNWQSRQIQEILDKNHHIKELILIIRYAMNDLETACGYGAEYTENHKEGNDEI